MNRVVYNVVQDPDEEDLIETGKIETRCVNYLKETVIKRFNFLPVVEFNNNQFVESYNASTNYITPRHQFIVNGKWKDIINNKKFNYNI